MPNLAEDWESAIPIDEKESEWERATPVSEQEWEAAAPVESQKKSGFWPSVGEAASERGQNVADIYSKNVPQSDTFMDSVNKAPERILQTVGQGAGLVNDVAFQGLRSAYRNLVPDVAQEAVSSGLKYIGENVPEFLKTSAKGVGDAYGWMKEEYPEGMRDVEAVGNIVGAIPVVKSGQAAIGGMKAVGREGVNIVKDVSTGLVGGQGKEALESKISRVIRRGVEKAIRPSVVGKKDITQINNYYDRATDAVKDIVANKDNLILSDSMGAVNKGALPKSLNQLSESIDQTKKNIFRQYDDLAKQAGTAGAKVELTPIVNELENIGKSVAIQDFSPELSKHIQDEIVRLTKRGFYTAEEAQDVITHLNKSLTAFYKNPTYENATKAGIDSMIANNLRKTLDTAITNAKGEGYQALKNSYGSLKAIEKDVAHRSIVDARKNIKGLIDFTDILTSGELMAGLATMNPQMIARGAFSRGVKSLYKHINDPNRIVKTMFADVENMINQKKGGYKSGLFKSIKGKERVFSRGEAPLRQPSIEPIEPVYGMPLLKPQPSNARSVMPSPLQGAESPGAVVDPVIQRAQRYGRETRRDAFGGIITKLPDGTYVDSKGMPLIVPQTGRARSVIPERPSLVEGGGVADEVIQRTPVEYGRTTRRDIGGENSILTKVQNETRIPSRELSPTEIFERNLARNKSEGINRGKGLADLHRFLKNTTRQGR